PGYQFPAGRFQFVRKTDVQQLCQTRVGVKADTVLIGDRDQHEVEQLLQARKALIESFAQETVIDPAEGPANGTSAIWSGRLRSRFWHFLPRQRQNRGPKP